MMNEEKILGADAAEVVTAERSVPAFSASHVAPKHTPGPWHWYGNKGLEALNETVLVGDCGSVLCGRTRLFVNEADKHLISAAPELLAACKKALRDGSDAYEVISAAVAKAEGRQS